ncbi:MAG: SMC family ATPase [bacterium]|nr:SMC family ATPase [bacterium]
MRPLELRLRNFRSFHGDHHRFDFRGRRLIGIVGPIGSGKSTILDAIAFALYGRTPRIGHATKSLIHQRADNAAVAFRFEVEGDVWEAVRNLRRTGSSQHALYRLPEDTADAQPDEKVALERDVNQRIEDLLGLDFHGFGRSVLLAQGQFAQFLNARPAERDKVLKGVFGYERVGEIRELARDAVRRANQAIKVLDVRIEHAEEAKARLDQRKDELAQVRRRLETLASARPLFEELTGRITQAEERRGRARDRLAALRERARELPDAVAGERVVEIAEQARVRAAAAERELGVAADRLEKAAAALESEVYRQAVKNLDKTAQLLAEIEAARDRTGSRLERLRKAEAALPERIKSIKTLALAEYAWARSVEARREWEDSGARLDEAEALLASRAFTGREERAARAAGLIIQLEARHEAADRAAREVVRVITTLKADETSERVTRSALLVATAERQDAEEGAAGAAVRLREAEGRLQDARHADMAGALRDQLSSGETCPVCEQPVHRVPSATRGDVSAAEGGVDRARSERNIAEERLREAIGGERAAEEKLDAAAARVAESRDRLEISREEDMQQAALLGRCLDELVGLLGEGDPKSRLDEERAALSALRATALAARQEREEKRAELDSAIEEERNAENALSELRTRIGTLGAKLDPDFKVPEPEPDAVRTALASLHTDWRRTTAHLEETFRTEQQKIDVARVRQVEEQARVDLFRTAANEARVGRDKALGVRDNAVAIEQVAGRDLSDLRASVGRLGAFLDPDFQVHQGDPAAVRDGLVWLHTGWNRTAADLESAVRDHGAERQEAVDRLGKEKARFEVEDSIEASLAEVRARARQIEADVKRDEKLVAGVVELLNERRKRRNEARLNQRLVSDLTDSRFIRFLLDEERATLADLGSEHFERLSSRRYRFTEDGKFDVVDLNSADAVRRADSLSGGETFLASLALALGLAEMVGRRGGRLDAFFLDEGFGTLDPEHLDLAMEGVESLIAHREQRLVVVVSHVPELRQRIEDLLMLDKHPATGDSLLVHGGAI